MERHEKENNSKNVHRNKVVKPPWFSPPLIGYPRGDSMISDFTGRRALPVRDYVVSIEGP